MNFEKIKVAIIGAGRWGFNHVRTANTLLSSEQIVVCDSNPDCKEKISELNNEIAIVSDIADVLNDSSINAVIIATPAETHYEVAKECIKAGKNLLVEKPITLFTEDAEHLERMAKEANVKIMVGHVLLYHPAVLKMKSEIESGKIGKIQYVYSNRLNLGAIRSEENILWSFAPHDISLVQYLTEADPIKIYACGGKFIQPDIEDTTLTYLEYPNNVRSHIYVSWLHPFKEQRLVVTGTDGMFVFEDSLKTEKLKFFKKGFKNNNGTLEKFDADYEVVEFENRMPLAEEQKHYYSSIINNTQPRTDGKHAVGVLRILEEATKSIKEKEGK